MMIVFGQNYLRQINDISMPNFVTIAEAAIHLKNARRLSVIGCSGGGKSTLSRNVESAHGLPHISIDRHVRWLAGWKVRDRQEQKVILNRYIAQDDWILDGTTISSFETRIPRSDLVLWVRPSRTRALWQLSKRVFSSYGRVRPDMAPGCPEQLPDREFLHYIWTFEKRQSPRIIEAIDRFGPSVPVFEIKQNADGARLILLSQQ